MQLQAHQWGAVRARLFGQSSKEAGTTTTLVRHTETAQAAPKEERQREQVWTCFTKCVLMVAHPTSSEYAL